jgi:hypothetical protein
MSNTAGSSGYGIRNNSGVVEFKNSGGSWLAPLSSSSISDTAYGVGWNGVTTIAPSQNAVYDEIESLNTPVTVAASGQSVVSTSLVDLTGLSVTLTAGTYLFEAEIHGASSSVAGYRLAMNYTGTTTSVDYNHFGQLATTTLGATARVTAINTASTTLGTTASAETLARMTGKIVVSDGGSLVVRGLKVTSGTYTVRASSFLRVTKVA